jgi:FkbM family methyltransferase
MLLDQRRLRGILRHILPKRLKDVLRGRLFGYRKTSVGTDWSLIAHDGSIELCLNGIKAKFPESARASLQYHCIDNADSIEELDGFIKHAKNNPGLLLDIGAADGLFSALYCLASTRNRAVAYEPSFVMYNHLVDHMTINSLLDRVLRVNAAVGQTTGAVVGSLNSEGMLIVDTEAPASAGIPMVCLDSHANEYGAPTAIKIDVEGYEGAVLRGACRLLSTHRPVLFLEFHLDLLEQQGESADELLKMLVQMGYQFESSLGAPLSVRYITTSPKAIIRFVARPFASDELSREGRE